MDSSLSKTIGLAALTAVMTVFVARVDGGATSGQAGGTLARDSALRADSVVTPKWLNDGNVVALVSVINGRQVAAANLELSSWHSDTVRALAASLAHEHSELQHSLDSVVTSIKIAPVPSALSTEVLATFQAQLDTLSWYRGNALDRAFVAQQINSHKLMAQYLGALGAVATAPELQAWLESASARVATQVSSLTGQQRAFVVRDSMVTDSLNRRADSLARRAAARDSAREAARRKRSTTKR